MCEVYEDYTPSERNLIAITRNQWTDDELRFGERLHDDDCCGECEEGLDSEE